MPAQILWYLTEPDGRYPWEPAGRWVTDFSHLRQLATTIDQLGFYGALLGTSGNDVLTVASSLISVTERMRFLAAVYPGLVSPTSLALTAQTIDRFSGGRLIFNVVNGNDFTLPQYGQRLAHDERYDFSAEYWDAFVALYRSGPEGFSGYDGRYISLAPRPESPSPLGRWLGPTQQPATQLWGAGGSPAGIAHAVRLVDTYLTFADTPPALATRLARVRAAADEVGRTLRYGVRLQVIVRETEEEAWEHAAWLLRHTTHETALNLIDRQFHRGYNLHTQRSDDPAVRRRLDALRDGRLPDVEDLIIYPNMWVGPSLFGFDIVSPAAGTYLVGSAENVAARIAELQSIGIDAFILSGYPLIEEAYRVAELLLPLLNLDVPALRVPTTISAHSRHISVNTPENEVIAHVAPLT
ncbi:MAG: LLM class flavin-dependent oxidoreductase [Gordonia sp. (in: high G+C Gram-positive bacteria)]